MMKNKLMPLLLGLFLLNSAYNFASYNTTSLTDGITTHHDTTYVINNTSSSIDTIENNDGIFLIQEESAEFPGGEDALYRFISKNLQYPQIAKNHGIEGKVNVILRLDETGTVSNIEVLNSIGGGCEEEIIRVLSEMPPWKPKKQAGHQVKSERIFSFTFKL